MDFYLNLVACNTKIKIKGEKSLKIKNKSFYKFGFVITCSQVIPSFQDKKFEYRIQKEESR